MAAKQRKDEGAQFVKYFGPLLDALRGLGGSAKPDEAVDRVSSDLSIPDEVLNETLPSGGSRFSNQVAWARFYLVREGLISSSKHGVWSLAEAGFKTNLTQVQARVLLLKWVKIFQQQRKQKDEVEEPIAGQVAEGTEGVSKDYRDEALEVLLLLAPAGFERLLQRLLREAGFTQVVVTGHAVDYQTSALASCTTAKPMLGFFPRQRFAVCQKALPARFGRRLKRLTSLRFLDRSLDGAQHEGVRRHAIGLGDLTNSVAKDFVDAQGGGGHAVHLSRHSM